MKQPAARHFGPPPGPGHEAPHENRQHRAASRENKRVPDEADKMRVGIGLDEIIECRGTRAVWCVLTERCEKQSGQRDKDQPDNNADAKNGDNRCRCHQFSDAVYRRYAMDNFKLRHAAYLAEPGRVYRTSRRWAPATHTP